MSFECTVQSQSAVDRSLQPFDIRVHMDVSLTSIQTYMIIHVQAHVQAATSRVTLKSGSYLVGQRITSSMGSHHSQRHGLQTCMNLTFASEPTMATGVMPNILQIWSA